MKLDHFHYLLEINRLHSISAAARSLHIRQTTLSAIVKSAEEELGFPIFQRAPTGVIATPAGEKFMTLAWEIDIKREQLAGLKQRSSDMATKISLLLAPAIAPIIPQQLSQRFQSLDGQGNLHFEECPSRVIGDKLLKGTASLGISFLTRQEIQHIQDNQEQSGITIDYLLQDQVYVIAAKDHPLAQFDEISMEQLLDQRLVTVKATREDAILGRAKASWQRLTVFSDLHIALQAVLEQDMIAILPRFTMYGMGRKQSIEDYCLIPLTGTPKENLLFLCLLCRREKELRRREKLLAECIRMHFQSFTHRLPEFACDFKEGEAL